MSRTTRTETLDVPFRGAPRHAAPSTHLSRTLRRALTTLMAVGASGCLGNIGQGSTETVAGEAFGIEATRQRTRLAAQNTETHLLGLIELNADRIIAATDDPEVARNALRWKAAAVPVVQRAAHHPDALISYVDEWILLLQMRDYLESGEGSDLFGEHQPLAYEPLAEMEQRLGALVERTLDSADYRTISSFVEGWAEENPIDNPLFVRMPVSSFAADVLGQAGLGGIEAVGRLEELAFDAQQMAQSYLAYTPKVVLWQTQLLVEERLDEVLDTAQIGPLLSQLDRLELSMAATALMNELPELVRAERAATTAEVAALTEASLAALMTLATREREMVLAEVAGLVRAERSALADDITESLIRALDEAGNEAIVVIDHTLWRIALMAAGLIVLLALAQLLLLRAFLLRRRSGGGAAQAG